MSSLSGAVAVISGGRGDLGSAIGVALHAAGARVSYADCSPLPDVIPDPAGGIHQVQLDVSDPDAVHAWLDEVEQLWGPPDIVIPAAATATGGDVLSMTPQQWSDELRVDLSGPYFLARDAAQRLRSVGRPGRIVMIGSWAAHAPHPHVPAYSVAKAGLRMLTRCLAIELAPDDILVNELAIGVVDAGVSRITFAEHPELRALSEQRAPVRHLVEVDEIVAEALALCDPTRRSMTGATILLDGGMSLRTAFTDDADA